MSIEALQARIEVLEAEQKRWKQRWESLRSRGLNEIVLEEIVLEHVDVALWEKLSQKFKLHIFKKLLLWGLYPGEIGITHLPLSFKDGDFLASPSEEKQQQHEFPEAFWENVRKAIAQIIATGKLP